MLSTDELIIHMKNKGIKFNVVDEESAKEFITNNNYYMKLAAYRTNYEKRISGDDVGKYINLEFAYLQELSTLDMRLRYIIIDMCLDIEHYIKVTLLEKLEGKEDGYQLVRKFVTKNGSVLKKIYGHKSSDYCNSLIDKYYPYFPVWVFVELISFGDLLYFCSFYEKIYGVQIINNKLMNTVRDVRNAAAHSNCLLNKMTEKIDSTKQVNNEISSFIIGMKNISKTSRVNNLSYKFTNSFVTVLYVYDSLMNEIPKQKRYKEIQEFMNGRVVKNKQFFQSNSKIVGVYNFHKKVIDNLVK